MKKTTTFILLLCCIGALAQQGGSLISMLPKPVALAAQRKHFGIYGIGTLNTEAFNNINGSGKGSIYGILDQNQYYTLVSYIAVNKNATNDDSTLASTLLFPDVGRSSFLGNVSYIRRINNSQHYFGGFCQGTFKFIKGQRNIKGTERDTSLIFSVLDWQVGVRYLNVLYANGTDNVVLSASAFLNFYNIPDEDNEDYRYIFDNAAMPSEFWAFGARIGVEVNRLQLYADFRHVFGTTQSLPSRDLRGFNLNVGFIFNADLFER